MREVDVWQSKWSLGFNSRQVELVTLLGLLSLGLSLAGGAELCWDGRECLQHLEWRKAVPGVIPVSLC